MAVCNDGCGAGATRIACLLALVLCVASTGCATRRSASNAHYGSSRPTYRPALRYAPPPGSASDPWGPYILEASARFGVPQAWIRAVMRQESGGAQFQGGVPTTSPVGAMGLMQVMPDTYAILRDRYGLGGDPYDPHDNILAGAAYIREMYDAYGFPSFLAAYNAGPHMLEACLIAGAPLPRETILYLSSVAPQLRPYATPSGPLAVYADLPVEMPADELNRRSLLGQPPPVANASAVMRVMPCIPPASDYSADRLNGQELASEGAPDGIAALLNR